jgi:excisionase family DNA binding protein
MIPASISHPAQSSQAENQAGRMADTMMKVFSVDDVAKMFQCGREKIKRMARRGELPAFKFGKHWYVRKDDLEHYLSGRIELSGHLRRIQEV